MESLARNIKIYPARAGVDLLHLDRDVAIGAGPDVFIVVWRDHTTIGGVATVAQTFGDYTRDRAPGIAMVTIIERQAKMPSPGSREPLARYLRNASSHALVSGVAFEGDGFVAASIRGVVVGLTMLARQSYPHRVFKNVADACQWIESERSNIGKHFRATDIQAATAKFRHLVAYSA